MKKLAFGALFIGLLAACGGGDDVMIVEIDAGDGIDASAACNPVANTGCVAGEKCTWINIDSANDVGTLGCVPDGSVATGGACTYGADGETTGYDNCQGGNICIYSVCEEICTDSPDSCPSTSACSSYAGLFPETSAYGACDFLCNPVDQTRDVDDAEACGSTTEIPRGCYMNNDDTFSCTGVPGPAQNLTQGATPYGPSSGGAYVNGCAAGYAPLLLGMSGGTTSICVAFCEPGEIYMGNAANKDGLAGSDYTCNARGAIGASDNQFECRHIWFLEEGENLDHNGFGFCMQPNQYNYDHDMNTTTQNVLFPHCDTLSNTDTDANDFPDHLEWACAPLPAAATGSARPPRKANLPFRVPTDLELKQYFQK